MTENFNELPGARHRGSSVLWSNDCGHHLIPPDIADRLRDRPHLWARYSGALLRLAKIAYVQGRDFFAEVHDALNEKEYHRHAQHSVDAGRFATKEEYFAHIERLVDTLLS